MKKFLISLFTVFIIAQPCNGAIKIKIGGNSDNGLNYLYNEITKLENELKVKTEKLNTCAAKNKNFQIAGIVTVGAAGAGLATNISLGAKIKEQVKKAENMKNTILAADKESEKFFNELADLESNLDEEKLIQEMAYSLTDEELRRFTETDYTSTLNESDKIILQKTVQAMRRSQKD